MKKKIGLNINDEKCLQCGLCERACILTKFCGYETIAEAPKKDCILCGHCIAVCPKGAIEHPEIREVTTIGEIPDHEQVLNLIKKTRSTREFKPNKVKPEHWEVIAETLKLSQTGLNSQDIDFIAIESIDKLHKIKVAAMKMFDFMSKIYYFPVSRFFLSCLSHKKDISSMEFEVYPQKLRKRVFDKGRDPILYGAPALLLLIGPKGMAAAKDNADIAAQNITITATALGLGSCYMGGITVGCNKLKFKPLIRALELPKGYSVYQALVLGYPTFKLNNMPERKERKIIYR